MDSNDRQAIDGLFSRIAEVERQSGPLDQEANAFIGQKIAAQPTAPYLMAQTIVVQDQALAAAESRIQELERQSSSRSSGGLFSSLFGGGSQATPARRAATATAYAPQQGGYGQTSTAIGQQQPSQTNSPWGNQGTAQQAQRSGGGFLQGAAQTAMGVAGGMLIGSAIGSMFSGGEANAAETLAEAEAPAEDIGADMGDDMGDMDF